MHTQNKNNNKTLTRAKKKFFPYSKNIFSDSLDNSMSIVHIDSNYLQSAELAFDSM